VGWRSALACSGIAYRELSFQAIYAVRSGNVLPSEDGERLIARTESRVLQSKALVGLLLGFMAFGGALALRPEVELVLGPGAPVAVYRTAVVAGLLLLQLSLLWTTGLQILPVYLGSRILHVLEALPIDPAELDRTALLLCLRLFDLPALAVLLLTPLAVGWALGSPLAGLALVPGAIGTVLAALALALATGEFFVRRVTASPSGAAAAVVRWAFLVAWAVPAFAIYAFISFSPEMLRALAGLAAASPPELAAVLMVFPFPFAYLPVAVGGGAPLGLDGTTRLAVLAAAIAYGAGLVAVGRWFLTAPRRVALRLPEVAPTRPGRPAPLRSDPPAEALLRKDLRIASRSPAYAFVVLLPLLDAVVIGLSTFVGNPSADNVFGLGAAAVSTSALLATFFGPAFFATEVMGYSYTRTLPLTGRSLLGGKLALILLVYGLSALLVLGFTLARVFAPWVFLAFVAAELPALAAAALLELGILFRVSARRGIAITNLYTGAWWATIVVLPGLAVMAAPLAAFHFAPDAARGLVAMGLLALGELAVVLPLALRWSSGAPA
jgi:predicted permease